MFRLAEAEPLPVAKVAGLKKLRTLTGDRQALGAEVSFLGVSVQLVRPSNPTSPQPSDTWLPCRPCVQILPPHNLLTLGSLQTLCSSYLPTTFWHLAPGRPCVQILPPHNLLMPGSLQTLCSNPTPPQPSDAWLPADPVFKSYPPTTFMPGSLQTLCSNPTPPPNLLRLGSLQTLCSNPTSPQPSDTWLPADPVFKSYLPTIFWHLAPCRPCVQILPPHNLLTLGFLQTLCSNPTSPQPWHLASCRPCVQILPPHNLLTLGFLQTLCSNPTSPQSSSTLHSQILPPHNFLTLCTLKSYLTTTIFLSFWSPLNLQSGQVHLPSYWLKF